MSQPNPKTAAFPKDISDRIVRIANLSGWYLYKSSQDAVEMLKAPVSVLEADVDYCLYPRGYRILTDWEREHEKYAEKIISLGKIEPMLFLPDSTRLKVCLPLTMVPAMATIPSGTDIVFRQFRPQADRYVLISRAMLRNENGLPDALKTDEKLGVMAWLPYRQFTTGLEHGLEIPEISTEGFWPQPL